MSNSEDSNISENKNLTEYEQLKQEAKQRGKQTAEYYIKRLYEALKKEGHRPEEIKGILLHDLIDTWSKATINMYIPEEAKDEQKVKAGKIGQEKKQEIKISNEGNTIGDIPLGKSKAEQSPVSQNKPNYDSNNNNSKVGEAVDDIYNIEDNEEPEPMAIEAIMNKNQARKFMNELRLDILSRLPESGKIKFSIDNGVLTYQLV